MPGNVFISYRREDTAGYAISLNKRLEAAFPGRVFIDVSAIRPGTDFHKVIERHIEGCAALVALIGKDWSTGDRLHEPDNFVRLEIAGALKRDISVIPVLVGAAKLPAAAKLPEDIQPLLRRHAISISDEDWDHGCERLIQALQAVLGPAHKKSHTGTRWAVALGAAVVVVLALILFWKTRNSQPPASTAGATPANMPATTHAAPEYDKSVAKGYENAAQVMGDVANKIGGSSNSAASPSGRTAPDDKNTAASLAPPHSNGFSGKWILQGGCCLGRMMLTRNGNSLKGNFESVPPGIKHRIDGTVDGSKARITVIRVDQTQCPTEMYGVLFLDKDDVLHYQIHSTDGRCNIDKALTDTRVWERYRE